MTVSHSNAELFRNEAERNVGPHVLLHSQFHMTEHDLKVLDTIDSPEYMSGDYQMTVR